MKTDKHKRRRKKGPRRCNRQSPSSPTQHPYLAGTADGTTVSGPPQRKVSSGHHQRAGRKGPAVTQGTGSPSALAPQASEITRYDFPKWMFSDPVRALLGLAYLIACLAAGVLSLWLLAPHIGPILSALVGAGVGACGGGLIFKGARRRWEQPT